MASEIEGIRHHFSGIPRNGRPHYRGITVVAITVQVSSAKWHSDR